MANIPWEHRKCVICLSDDSVLTLEHVIPDCLGGRLTSQFVCKICNSTFGNQIEAAAKIDPSIQLAIYKLHDKFHETLRLKLMNGQPVIATSSAGSVRGNMRKGSFKVRSHKAPDGSLIQPTDIGRKSLTQIMRKGGHKEEFIRLAVAAFDKTPDDQEIEVAPGLKAVKWNTVSLSPDLSESPLLSVLVPVKIAYEFMALHVGDAIYSTEPPLVRTRHALQSGDTDSMAFKVERLTSDKYEPFHGICFEGNSPHATVLIRLFGWLAFRVHFLELAFGGQRVVYTHRLDTNNENMQVMPN